VVELELLQRGERTVTLLGEREPALVRFARLAQPVLARRRLAQERNRHEQHRRDGDDCREYERSRHPRASA
jgi:hypothetical protein